MEIIATEAMKLINEAYKAVFDGNKKENILVEDMENKNEEVARSEGNEDELKTSKNEDVAMDTPNTTKVEISQKRKGDEPKEGEPYEIDETHT